MSHLVIQNNRIISYPNHSLLCTNSPFVQGADGEEEQNVSTSQDTSIETNSPKERRKRELRMTPEEEADETILLDIDDQTDPELQEMVDYVKKLAQSGPGEAVMKPTDDENVIEYYWKPNHRTSTSSMGSQLQSWQSGSDICTIQGPRPKAFSIAYESAKYRRQSLAESIIIPKSMKDNCDADSLVSLEKEAEDYKHVWGIEIPNVKPLTEFRTKHVSSRRHSVAYESPQYNRSGRRRTSLAETMIIPKSVQVGYDFATFVAMEREAEEYNQLWGLNMEPDKITDDAPESPVPQPRSRQSRRRSSLAESLIIPRSSRDGLEFSTFAKMEQEGEEYNRIWGLNLPTLTEDEVNQVSAPKPPSRLRMRRSSAQHTSQSDAQKNSRNKSHSISMGILSRRALLMTRRPSIADLAIIPRTASDVELDEATLLRLDNEALEYKQAFPDIDMPELSITEPETETEHPLDRTETDTHALDPIRESSRSASPVARVPTPHKIDYNEWYHKFGDQTTSHLETTFSDEDEEVAAVTSTNPPQAKTHIFYNFPKRSSPLSVNLPPPKPESSSRPTTPADYNEYMSKFPDQLSPDIVLEDRRSPASLETYLKEMESPGYLSPTTIHRPTAPPATLEVYLERMRSKSPSPMPK